MDLNTIHPGDCIAGMKKLPDGSVDLAFADPPFNIGYDYDVYDDTVEHPEYIDWSNEWISQVHRVLKPDGAFWLAIGDEYAAELKLESQNLGFHCRSWVIWYYTFGVNCSKKFTRSHAHLFHFVKDPDNFTFLADDLDNRIPSARQLVYNDKRANPKGRLPDDTWIIPPANTLGEMAADDAGSWSPSQIAHPTDQDQTFTLRPQDVAQCFKSSEDTWYFPRVAGTFKERAGFHGCQMPEQLLARIIRVSSNPGETVLDPFSGSATTLAVAKKLARQFIGFELSDDYVRFGLARLDSVRLGDRPDGSAEPLMSAPKTGAKQKGKAKTTKKITIDAETAAKEKWYSEQLLALTKTAIKDAFRLTHDGFSADRVVADPDLNNAFSDQCQKFGIVGDPKTWNTLLFRLRKDGQFTDVETSQRTSYSWEEFDKFIFGSEIALQLMLDEGLAESLDEILCDPDLAADFDQRAQEQAPGHSPLEYRWAALRLRKEAMQARRRGSVLTPPKKFDQKVQIKDLELEAVPDTPGMYVISESSSSKLYVGETLNLRNRFKKQFNPRQKKNWSSEFSDKVCVETLSKETSTAGKLVWQSCLINKFKQKPRLNYFELQPTV